MRVSATLNGKIDKYGRKQVYIRISDGRLRSFQKTGIWVKPGEFEKGKVKGVLAKKHNEFIRSEIAKIELGQFTRNEKRIYLLQFWDECMKEWKHTKAPGTLRYLESHKRKVQGFTKDVPINSINGQFLAGYVAFCKEKGNQPNTIWSSVKSLKTIVNTAYKKGLIIRNPFASFKSVAYKQTNRLFLSKQQVESIKPEEYPEEIKIAAVWFLISCYTGLRLGDIKTFSAEKHIKSNRIVLYTSKTGEVVSLPITSKIKALFELVDYQPIPFTDMHYNRLLKVIGIKIGVPGLSSHVARHTFATLCASAGISQEVTAKFLGHSSTKVTAVYYKIASTRMDEEFIKIM